MISVNAVTGTPKSMKMKDVPANTRFLRVEERPSALRPISVCYKNPAGKIFENVNGEIKLLKYGKGTELRNEIVYIVLGQEYRTVINLLAQKVVFA